MNAIQELFKNSASWTTVIFVVLVLLFAIKEIIIKDIDINSLERGPSV